MTTLISLSEHTYSLATDIRLDNASLTSSVSRLSSGSRLPHADVGYFAVANKMSNKVSSLRAGLSNIAQATSMLKLADDSLRIVEDILQRMNSLSIMARSGGTDELQRYALDHEFQQLKEEINHILEQTSFHDNKIFIGQTVQTSTLEAIHTIVSSSQAFELSSISDLVIWLDAADRETIFDQHGVSAENAGFSGSVALWEDKSGQANHVSQSNAAERPLFIGSELNSIGAIRFDGNNDRLPGSVPTTTNELTSFVVFNRTGGGGSREFLFEFGRNSENSRDMLGLKGNRPLALNIPPGGATAEFDFNNTVTFGDYAMLASVMDGADLLTTLNGEIDLDISIAPRDRDPSTAFVVGDDSTSGDELHGHIAELIGFDRALTTNEREEIEGYLAHKYDLQATLPATHTYKNAGPSGAFANDPGSRATTTIENGATLAVVSPSVPGTYSFSILKGNEDGALAIDSASGTLTIADKEALGNTSRFYTLDIGVDDGTSLSTLQATVNLNATVRTEQNTGYSFLTGDLDNESFAFNIGHITLADIFTQDDINIRTDTSAADAFDAVQQAIDFIIDRRAYTGAKISQADHLNAALSSNVYATEYSHGRIADTDIVQESTLFALLKVNLETSINVSANVQNLHAVLVGDLLGKGIQLTQLETQPDTLSTEKTGQSE